MSKIRNINELLTILQIVFRDIHTTGSTSPTSKCLCATILDLRDKGIISVEEYDYLDLYIDKNQPFTFYNLFHSNGYYWKPYKTEPRLRWLSKHIKKTLKQ
jgi:hypothetical protein